MKGYRLIDLSSDRLIIERSVQFKESISHVPQQSNADTFVLPPVNDEHAHADSSSDESSNSEDSDDSDTESIQSDAESARRCSCRAKVEAQVGQDYTLGCTRSCWGSS
jgi:hypothetical protein